MVFRLTNRIIGGALLALCLTTRLSAEELKYQPVNPSFGGNPFNGAYLLQSATAQRQFQAPRYKSDALSDISDDIKRSILSRVSEQISSAILGKNAQDHGTFDVSGMHIDFHQADGQVVIHIVDPASKGETEITVPKYTSNY